MACIGHPQKQQGDRQGVRPAGVMKAGTIAAALSLAVTLPVEADDGRRGTAQIASVSGGQDVLPFRLGMPPRPPQIDTDLKVLLVQNRAATKTDAVADDDTILVALASSVAQSVDEDIAKQYDLELLERTELPALGLRILQFRAPSSRPTGPLLSELRNDHRIRRAQINAQYGQPSQGASPEIGRLNGPPSAETKAETARKAPAVAVAKVVQKSPEHEPASAIRPGRSLKGEVVQETAPQPLRVGRVGDVLSGGL